VICSTISDAYSNISLEHSHRTKSRMHEQELGSLCHGWIEGESHLNRVTRRQSNLDGKCACQRTAVAVRSKLSLRRGYLVWFGGFFTFESAGPPFCRAEEGSTSWLTRAWRRDRG